MSEQTFLLILSVLLVAVIVALLSFLSAVLWQLVKILREVRGIMSTVRLGSDSLAKDLSSLRSHIKTLLIGRLSRRFGAVRKRKNTSPESNAEEEE